MIVDDDMFSHLYNTTTLNNNTFTTPYNPSSNIFQKDIDKEVIESGGSGSNYSLISGNTSKLVLKELPSFNTQS